MDVAYCDTETTGLREPHRLGGRRTWEIAIVRVPEAGGPVAACWLQIVDVDLADADPASLDVGRFHQRWSAKEGPRYDVPAAPIDGEQAMQWNNAGQMVPTDRPRTVRLRGATERDAARVVESLTRGAVLAGSNPGFDAANFADLLDRNGLPAGWYHHHRDIPNVATGWLLGAEQAIGGPAQTDWAGTTYSTAVLAEACGVEVPADRHSAWADTVWMWRWDRLLRGIELPDTVTA